MTKTLSRPASSPFLGLFYKDTKSTALSNDPDYVEYFIPPVNTTAIASDTDAAMSNSYSIKVINTETTSSNKYLAFVGGDHGVVKITTDAQSDKSIVVIKESYAKPLCRGSARIIKQYMSSIRASWTVKLPPISSRRTR